MRAFLVGIVFLSISGSAAFGQQVSGFVEKIGFGKAYRPYGWTPVLVNLHLQGEKPADFQIQIRQEDLDRDRVVFRRDIVLNPNKNEQFWVYFQAQPRGLGEGSPAELMQMLDVRLCERSGKPLLKLQINDPALNMEPGRQSFTAYKGAKLVLMVAERTSARMSEYNGSIGLNEDVIHVPVTPFDLPENVIGYDAVDAVVWLDADAAKMTGGGSKRLAALTDWVRSGGRLVVTQPGTEMYRIEPMADLLPIELKNDAGDWLVQMRDRKTAEPLRTLAEYNTPSGSLTDGLLLNQRRDWNWVETERGPLKVAFAKLRPDAMGEQWIDWKGDGTERSPWIARRPLGLGSVTWVAQDLASPSVVNNRTWGWPNVWDAVFGSRNTNIRTPAELDNKLGRAAEEAKQKFYSNSAVDIGASMLRGMEHEGRAGGLVFLAGVFFVGYWVVAGPVSYLVLAGKKRTELSWTIFAVSAMVATLLTVGVVKLVLRGDAEVHHVSLVRLIPAGRAEDGSPISRAVVNSRIGLYIPRDGMQTVSLADNDPAGLSYITPFSIHPAYQGSSTEFPAYLDYTVPVRDNPLTDPVSVDVPFRSTLKKLQARWVGYLKGGIESVGGPPKIIPGDRKRKVSDNKGGTIEQNIGTISGTLVNKSGADLAHVYIAFLSAPFEGAANDEVLYIPAWPRDGSIKLEDEFNGARSLPLPSGNNPKDRVTPGGSNKLPIRDTLNNWAVNFWYPGLRGSGISDQFDDSRNEFLRSFPLLSLYDRIPPKENLPQQSDRVEVLRRAAREWDISEQIPAGNLVVLAQAGKPGARSDEAPLPFPLDVNRDRIAGTGVSFYQFALPLDRSEAPKPYEPPDPAAATPATRPVAAPAKVEKD